MARFGMDLPAAIIEEQVATALDLVVMSARRNDGSRRITSLSQVGRATDGSVSLVPLVSYDPARDRWRLEREPDFLDQAIRAEQLSESEVERWRDSMS